MNVDPQILFSYIVLLVLYNITASLNKIEKYNVVFLFFLEKMFLVILLSLDSFTSETIIAYSIISLGWETLYFFNQV